MQLSRKQVVPRVWEQVWESLIQFVQKSRKENEIGEALLVLLGPTERVMVAKRLMVGVLVMNEWDAYAIAELLKMSRATIYKHKVFLEMSPGYQQLLQRIFPNPIVLEKQKGDKIFLEQVLDMLYAAQRGSRKMLYD